MVVFRTFGPFAGEIKADQVISGGYRIPRRPGETEGGLG
jgi:hypothetical protein